MDEDTDAVGFVDHDGGAVFVLQLNDGGEIAQVALHREDAVDHDEFHRIGSALLELLLQVVHVVVLEAQLFGHREATAVDDRGVVAVVAEDVVVRTEESGDDTAVDGKSGGEAERLLFAHKGGQLLFQLHVEVERAVEEAAAGAA